MQLKFRQKVLSQSLPDSSLFMFSSKGKAHSLEKLKDNLCRLVDDIEQQVAPEQETLSFEDILLQPELLIGRKIKHRFEVDGNLVWYEGVIQQLNFITNEFQVAYEGEEDLSWFPLIDDIRSGDLLLF